MAAFNKVGVAGTGVVAQIHKDKALEAIKRVRYQSLLVAGLILSLFFGVVYFFSGTITHPIRAPGGFDPRYCQWKF